MMKRSITLFLLLSFLVLTSSAALAAPSDTALLNRSPRAEGAIGTRGDLGSGGPGGILD